MTPQQALEAIKNELINGTEENALQILNEYKFS